jgi:hypothetical protein
VVICWKLITSVKRYPKTIFSFRKVLEMLRIIMKDGHLETDAWLAHNAEKQRAYADSRREWQKGYRTLYGLPDAPKMGRGGKPSKHRLD